MDYDFTSGLRINYESNSSPKARAIVPKLPILQAGPVQLFELFALAEN
jgi:hypothetical protein